MTSDLSCLRRSPAVAVVCLSLLAGCFSAFNPRQATEVSRDKLLQISEKGTTDHLQYRGSDFQYHYVFDTRPGKEQAYKVPAKAIKLKDTFSVGEDAYVLYPWVIEGVALGTRPDDELVGMQKAARKSQPYLSDMSGAPQSVVESAPESDVGKDIGDDAVEPEGIEAP